MKKIFFIFLFFISVNVVKAEEIEVKFSDCVDGDTAKFIYKDEVITARFLAIDTPETVHPTKEEESFGKEASEYTCKKIKEAKKIILEYDKDSDKLDKYNRHLVWVLIDDVLLQKRLVEKGLASVAYLYGDYKYTDILEKAEQKAEEDKLGIWSIKEENNEEVFEEIQEIKDDVHANEIIINSILEEYKHYIILLGALIIVYTFNLKSKNKIKTKLKKQIKKDIKKRLK